MPAAVIFDVDGTLLASVDLHARAWQEAFALFGYNFGFAEIRSQIGKGGDQLIPSFLSDTEVIRIGEKLEGSRSEIWTQKYMARVQPFPGVRALFERLKSEGTPVALASSAKGDELEYYKKRLDIVDLLDAETSSDDAARSKPHPDNFAAALRKLAIHRPDRVWVVGDSPYDAEAAMKLHIPAIGVRCGGFPEDVLWRAGFRRLYDSPQDLLENFDDSPLGSVPWFEERDIAYSPT